VTAFVACLNVARGGRSSRTYLQEGSWDIALREAQTKGYQHVWVLIQFGHNDQPGNSRSTELAQEFPGYIRRYVEDAREAGPLGWRPPHSPVATSFCLPRPLHHAHRAA
jgi:lysophospholipase L1-like esterase